MAWIEIFHKYYRDFCIRHVEQNDVVHVAWSTSYSCLPSIKYVTILFYQESVAFHSRPHTHTHTRSLSEKKREKGPLDQLIRTWPEPSRSDWCCSVVGLYFKCFLLIVRPSTTTELINLWCAFCRNAWEIRGKRWNAYTRNMCKCCALTISPLGARRKTTKMKLDGNKNLLCILIYYHWLNVIIDGRMEHKPKTDK